MRQHLSQELKIFNLDGDYLAAIGLFGFVCAENSDQSWLLYQ
jgi:hypothetical protein